MDELINKEQFLVEHNRLSPLHLQTTLAGLTLFQIAKKPLLKDNNWSFKLRVPLILWLGSLPAKKQKLVRKSTKLVYKNYPETHNI